MLTDEELKDALTALEFYKTPSKAAQALGLDRQNLEYRVKIAKNKLNKKNEIEFPELPADDIPIENVIDIMCERFAKRNENYEAKKWMEFKVNSDEPIGINWFGDPHIDDNGCNWTLLKQHIDICKNTEGMYGANIGDSHNNWVGRLVSLYAKQDTSEETAWRLVDWLFNDSGVNWLIILIGNHDAWKDTRMLKEIAKYTCPMVDWRAQFKLKFSNGVECLIDASHDHKGHSQWNNLHGQQKASVMGGIANLYIAGHKHNWGLKKEECPHTNRKYWLARCRGYKYIDEYSDRGGFGSQKDGASIVTVINPKAKNETSLITCFDDVEAGADYLTYLRKK